MQGLLPAKARIILMTAAMTRPGELERARQIRIEEAHERVKRLFPQYFKPTHGGVHDVRSEGE